MGNSGESKDVTVSFEELTRQIKVQVRVAATQNKPSKIGTFKVDINEKICEALGSLIGAALEGGGTILFKNTIISNDDTFLSKNVLMNDKFLAMGGGSARYEPLLWRRFVNI